MTGAIGKLQRLRSAGFGGLPVVDALGQLDALLLTRVHRGVIDCLLVRSETEAIAPRVRDEHHPRDPLRPQRSAALWSYVGDLVAAVIELLALPAPGERGAPNLARPGPSDLCTPRTGPR